MSDTKVPEAASPASKGAHVVPATVVEPPVVVHPIAATVVETPVIVHPIAATGQKSIVVGRCTIYADGKPKGHKPGETIAVSADEADALVAGGLATFAGAPAPGVPHTEMVSQAGAVVGVTRPAKS